jgi:hypothetical protein
MTPCDVVTERLALGEPLADVEAHVATCPACSRLVALPRLVAASAHAAEPHAGFAVRTAAGARTKLAVRRRNRILVNTTGALAAAAIAVLALRTPDAPANPSFQIGAYRAPAPLAPVNDSTGSTESPDELAAGELTDDDLGAELARISDFDRAIAPSPAWRTAEAPLAPYRLIVHQGVFR